MVRLTATSKLALPTHTSFGPTSDEMLGLIDNEDGIPVRLLQQRNGRVESNDAVVRFGVHRTPHANIDVIGNAEPRDDARHHNRVPEVVVRARVRHRVVPRPLRIVNARTGVLQADVVPALAERRRLAERSETKDRTKFARKVFELRRRQLRMQFEEATVVRTADVQ